MRLRSLVVVALLAMTACTAETTDTTADGGVDTTAGSPTTADPGGTTAPSGGDAEITISGFSFGAPITVSVGEAVTVSNDDTVPHTWTSDDDVFDSDNISPGDSFEHTFEEAGEYPFFCKIHSEMTGSITVEG